jgi:hypothetical protein
VPAVVASGRVFHGERELAAAASWLTGGAVGSAQADGGSR